MLARTSCLWSKGFTHFILWLKLWKALRVFHSLHALYAPFERVQREQMDVGNGSETNSVLPPKESKNSQELHLMELIPITRRHWQWLAQPMMIFFSLCVCVWLKLCFTICHIHYPSAYSLFNNELETMMQRDVQMQNEFRTCNKLNEHGIFADVNFEIDFIAFKINVFIWV